MATYDLDIYVQIFIFFFCYLSLKTKFFFINLFNSSDNVCCHNSQSTTTENQNEIIHISNISPLHGPNVWVDSCTGGPNVRVIFVVVRTNVWVKISPGIRTSTFREPPQNCLTYSPSCLMLLLPQ